MLNYFKNCEKELHNRIIYGLVNFKDNTGLLVESMRTFERIILFKDKLEISIVRDKATNEISFKKYEFKGYPLSFHRGPIVKRGSSNFDEFDKYFNELLSRIDNKERYVGYF